MAEKILELLASLADAYTGNTASIAMWGEEEMPECLRENTEE